jgi:ankyrin repeat protein
MTIGNKQRAMLPINNDININITDRVYQSLKRICGGGIQSRSDLKSSCACHAKLPIWSLSCRSNETRNANEYVCHPRDDPEDGGVNKKDREGETEWFHHLLELAKSSISLSNGQTTVTASKATAKATAIHDHVSANNNAGTLDIGKAHDIEIRTALSFFHKYRHVCHLVKPLHSSSSSSHSKKRKKRRKTSSTTTTTPEMHSNVESLQPQNDHENNYDAEQNCIPPLEVVSDLGLVRSIYTPYDLSTLLVQDQLWHERTSCSFLTGTRASTIATTNNTTTNTNANNNTSTETNGNVTKPNKKHAQLPDMIRADPSGIICMVTSQRVQYLYQNGRYPCSRCVKWCKGEKGLWWHEQREHGIDHEHAITIAYATTGGDMSSALVLYEPTQPTQQSSDTCCIVATATEPTSTRSLSKGGENIVMETREEDSIFDIVKNGNLKKLKHLLTELPISDIPRHLDKNGASILHWSAGCGHLHIVKYLVEELGCPPNQPQNGKRSFQGRTPLHWSARNGHLSMVEYLVEKCQIDIDATTGDGTTAFCWASWQGHLDIMMYLQRRVANTGIVNIFGCNAALWSAQSSRSDLNAIKWLYSIGCDISLVNSNGHGMLHKSAQRGKDDVCKWMLSVAESSDASNIIPLHVFKLMGPDAENCFPSDLAGMEKHTSLARWLASKEVEVCSKAFQNCFKNDMTALPPWLKEGIGNARHEVNRVGVGDLWERGAGIRRVCASIFSIGS